MTDNGWHEESIRVGDCTLVADVRDGDGTPSMFLHGAGRRRGEGRPLFEGTTGPVILPDSRGHGDSVDGDFRRQSWQQLIEDACAWIDHFDFHDVFVSGVSMGEIVAPGVAKARPDRVGSLGLFYPVVLGNDVPPDPEHWAALEILLGAFSTPDVDAILATLSALAPDADLAEERQRLTAHASIEGLCAYFQGERGPESLNYTTADLAALTIPVTVVGGADPFHPASVAQRLAALIPGSRLVETVDVPTDEHEAVWADAICDMLARD